MKEALVCRIDCAPVTFALADPTEQPVIGADKELLGAFDYERTAVRTDTGIDDRHMNRTRGKVPVTRQQIERGRFDILRRKVMSDVDDLRVRVLRKDDSLHRPDKIILGAEIG